MKALLSLLLSTSIAHAADTGPIVTEIPGYDRATCERIFWTIIAVEESIEAGCPARSTAKQCRAYLSSLRLQSERLQSLYIDGGCHRWTA